MVTTSGFLELYDLHFPDLFCHRCGEMKGRTFSFSFHGLALTREKGC